MGGLGNQLFQYATGRALSNRLNVPLKFDTTFLLDRSPRENFTYRDFGLCHFNILGKAASEKEINRYTNKNVINRLFNRALGRNIAVYFYEKSINFNQEFKELPAHTYLEGYWQTEKYFNDIRTLLLEELSFKNAPNGENAKLLESIAQEESVSIHIRRGDFISNVAVNEFHGACNVGYYERAIEMISKYTINPILYFFSDDIDWAKSNFENKHPNSIFISNNANEYSFEDLRLMSICKHNIIANSSFSWWGAWLNNNPAKIVIAPSQWFSKPGIDFSDIVPTNWMKI